MGKASSARIVRRKESGPARSRARGTPAGTKFSRLVGRFTNYQRNRWARRGYPGLLWKDRYALEQWIETQKEVK